MLINVRVNSQPCFEKRVYVRHVFAPQALAACLQKEIPTCEPVDEASMKSNIRTFLAEVHFANALACA